MHVRFSTQGPGCTVTSSEKPPSFRRIISRISPISGTVEEAPVVDGSSKESEVQMNDEYVEFQPSEFGGICPSDTHLHTMCA